MRARDDTTPPTTTLGHGKLYISWVFPFGSLGRRLGFQPANSDNGFRSLLLESIDETILQLLGQGPLQATFYALKTRAGMTRDDIPSRLEDFQKGLVVLFGKSGAPVVSRVVVRTLCGKIGIPYHSRSDYDLVKHIVECRRKFEEQKASVRR